MIAAVAPIIPAYGWRPRRHQRRAWKYLQAGGKHAELIWHRRAGKDELALQYTATAVLDRPANYWHMLPLATQVRKAIWTAVNPHTGRRRIDEAFPNWMRRTTRDHEMQIEFINGSTWQALGSDNFQGSIGSSPAGIVYSEWAQSDPSARGYLRPILLENNGWQLFITTPRGSNHAKRTYEAAKRDPLAFAELLTVEDTGLFTREQLDRELQAYIDDHGPDFGRALFEQEYNCSFTAAIIGAYYGAEMQRAEREGRITLVRHDPRFPVFTAWDLGFNDDTSIWFYQVIGGKVRIIDYYYASGQGVAHYAGQLIGREVELTISTHRVTAEYGAEIPEAAHRKAYVYGRHNLPHDAEQRRVEAAGKSIRDQLAAVVEHRTINIVPNESLETGIQAVRAMLPVCYFDADSCHEGIEALRQYQREWDDERKVFENRPLHNWCSHPADAFRYLALSWRHDAALPPPPKKGITPFTEEWLMHGTPEPPKPRWK